MLCLHFKLKLIITISDRKNLATGIGPFIILWLSIRPKAAEDSPVEVKLMPQASDKNWIALRQWVWWIEVYIPLVKAQKLLQIKSKKRGGGAPRWLSWLSLQFLISGQVMIWGSCGWAHSRLASCCVGLCTQ